MVGATGIEPVTPTMSRECSSAERRGHPTGGLIDWAGGRQAAGCALPRRQTLNFAGAGAQAASIFWTSLTRSRRWIGLDSTLACLGAVESAFSATAAKPVMNMI